MFLKYKISVKIILLSLLFYIVYLLSFFFYQLALNETSNFLGFILGMVQCWVHILFGFFIFQTFKNIRIPARFYVQRNFETERFFRNFGVLKYQYFLVHSFLRYANPRVYLKGRKRDYLKIFHEETKQSETSHLFSMIPTFFVQFLFLYQAAYTQFIYLTLATLLFNVYPMLLQRKNRFLIESRFKRLFES